MSILPLNCFLPDNAARQLGRLEEHMVGLEEFPEKFRHYEKEPWHSRELRVMTALRHMRCKVSYAFFALKIRKIVDMKMSEAMENVTENTPAEKAGERKAEKYVRLGERRINKAIDAIGRIENLANRSAYDYTPEQVEAMFSVLETKVEEVKAKFTVKKAKENTAFFRKQGRA